MFGHYADENDQDRILTDAQGWAIGELLGHDEDGQPVYGMYGDGRCRFTWATPEDLGPCDPADDFDDVSGQ